MTEKFTQKITANPSQFSLREEALSLKLKGKEKKFPISRDGSGKDVSIYIDEETGEKFNKIITWSAPWQKLISILLKGVVNVSDIVKVEYYYYSHEQNFNYLDSFQENTESEIKADCFIISRIFGDYDHVYYPHGNSERKEAEKKIFPSSILEHHNLLADEKRGKFSFFDFGATSLGKDYKNPKKNHPTLINEIKEEITYYFDKDPKRNEILDILKRKVEILARLYSDDEFKRFEKIIQRSGVRLKEKEQKALYGYIKERLISLNKLLSEIN